MRVQLEPDEVVEALVAWVREKFGVEVTREQMRVRAMVVTGTGRREEEEEREVKGLRVWLEGIPLPKGEGSPYRQGG